jgi:molybdopterin converting factor small subunit
MIFKKFMIPAPAGFANRADARTFGPAAKREECSMSVTVLIPSPLRPFTGNQHAVSAEAGTVAAVLARLSADFPGLGENLLTPGGRLQPFVHAFVGGKDVAALAGLDTPVPDGGELLILQAISGG